MAPPILGIHPCQSRIPNDQEILAVLLFRGNRPIIGAGDNDFPIEDHDFIVCPGVPPIEGDRNPCRHQACDGWDGGMVRLCVGIEEDMDVDAPVVGVYQRPGQPRRV